MSNTVKILVGDYAGKVVKVLKSKNESVVVRITPKLLMLLPVKCVSDIA